MIGAVKGLNGFEIRERLHAEVQRGNKIVTMKGNSTMLRRAKETQRMIKRF